MTIHRPARCLHSLSHLSPLGAGGQFLAQLLQGGCAIRRAPRTATTQHRACAGQPFQISALPLPSRVTLSLSFPICTLQTWSAQCAHGGQRTGWRTCSRPTHSAELCRTVSPTLTCCLLVTFPSRLSWHLCLYCLEGQTTPTRTDLCPPTSVPITEAEYSFSKAACIQVPCPGSQASIHTSDLALSTALASSCLSTAALPAGAEAYTETSRHTLEQRAGVPALHTALRRGHRRTYWASRLWKAGWPGRVFRDTCLGLPVTGCGEGQCTRHLGMLLLPS